MIEDAPLHGHTVLFGGSFDPPHLGHQVACLALCECLGAEVVWLLPAATHPFGKKLSDFAHRQHMCRLLAAPFAGRVEVRDDEAQLGGPGRTYDLILHMQHRHPTRRFALAIGADVVADTPRWYRWEAIVAAVRVVVLGRSGYAADSDTPPLPPVASHQLRERAARGEPLWGQVSLAVAHYIDDNALYRRQDKVSDLEKLGGSNRSTEAHKERC